MSATDLVVSLRHTGTVPVFVSKVFALKKPAFLPKDSNPKELLLKALDLCLANEELRNSSRVSTAHIQNIASKEKFSIQ